MKLAEALIQRGDQEKKIRELRARIQNSARYVEGEEPQENITELFDEALHLIQDQAALIAKINKTNTATVLPLSNGMTLTEALAIRASLSAQAGLMNDAASAASPGRDLFGGRRRSTDLPAKTDLPVPELRARADNLSRSHRELDTQIQQLNWVTDLL